MSEFFSFSFYEKGIFGFCKLSFGVIFIPNKLYMYSR